MKKIQIILFLILNSFSLLAQFEGGRLQDVRINASLGTFTSAGGASYTGSVGSVGSTGYTVDSIAIGDLLMTETNIYRVTAVTITTPGSIASLTVLYLQGTTGTQAAPSSGRGMIVRPTLNLGLLLLTQNGSNFITEEQEAKALTHNFMVIDSLLGNRPDTSLQRFNQFLTSNRQVSGDGTFARTLSWLNLDHLFTTDSFRVTSNKLASIASDTLNLDGTNQLRVKTPMIDAGTAEEGWVLMLIDSITGEAEWQDVFKGVTISDKDSIYYNNGFTTVLIDRKDTIFASVPRRYNAGNGCWVYATGTGVTYTKSVGTGTLTIPSGVDVISFNIVAASGDLNSGELTITFIHQGTVSFNQSNATLYFPTVTIVNRNVLGPTDPYLQRPDDAGDSVDIFKNQWTSAGQSTIKITGLSGDISIEGNY